MFECNKCIGTSSEQVVYIFSLRDYDYKKQFNIKFTIFNDDNVMFLDGKIVEIEENGSVAFNLNAYIVKSDNSIQLIFDKPIMYYKASDDQFFEMTINGKSYEPKDYYNKRLNKIIKKENRLDRVYILYGLIFNMDDFNSDKEYKKRRTILGQFLLDNFESESYNKKLKTVKSKKIKIPQLNWNNLYETFSLFRRRQKDKECKKYKKGGNRR
jgi:hypothetical protein